MEGNILTITAVCGSLSLDALRDIEELVKEHTGSSSVQLTVSPASSDERPPLLAILTRCAEAFGVPPHRIRDRGRLLTVVFARHAYCHVARKNRYTLEEIGQAIGRNHATVVSSLRASHNLIFSKVVSYTAPLNSALQEIMDNG